MTLRLASQIVLLILKLMCSVLPKGSRALASSELIVDCVTYFQYFENEKEFH